MAGLFDQGRERAKRIVDKVTKAARTRDPEQPVTIDSRAETATGQLPTTAKKAYGFTTFKRALDDTDTLLFKINSMRTDSDVSQRDQGAASTSAAASKADQVGSSSKQGPLTEGMSAWDLPLSLFQRISMPRAPIPANAAVQMTSQLTESEDSDGSASTDSQQQSTTAAAAPGDDASAAPRIGTDVYAAADEAAALGTGPNAGSKGVVYTKLKEQIPAEAIDDTSAAHGPSDSATAAAAVGAVPEEARAVPEAPVGGLEPPTFEPAAPVAAALDTSSASPRAEQDPAAPSVDKPAADGSAVDAATTVATAGIVPEGAIAFGKAPAGSLEPPTLEAAAPATAAADTPLFSSSASSQAGSSDVDAVLEVQPQTASTACADSPDHSDHLVAGMAEVAPNSTAARSSSKASSSVNRPGVVDAANLIAPGLVAKRRAAAIAAVESKAGPSPELQASVVIETEGKADTKSQSHVTLSMW